jgi:hypothetical protein
MARPADRFGGGHRFPRGSQALACIAGGSVGIAQVAVSIDQGKARFDIARRCGQGRYENPAGLLVAGESGRQVSQVGQRVVPLYVSHANVSRPYFALKAGLAFGLLRQRIQILQPLGHEHLSGLRGAGEIRQIRIHLKDHGVRKLPEVIEPALRFGALAVGDTRLPGDRPSSAKQK